MFASVSRLPPARPLYPLSSRYWSRYVYGGLPQYAYNPVQRIYPGAYYPLAQTQVVPQSPDTRQLVKFENFMEINSKFVMQTAATTGATPPTTTADQVIVGTVNVQQNLLTDFLNGNEAQYKIYVQTSGTLDLTGQNIMLGLAADCVTAATGTAVFAT